MWQLVPRPLLNSPMLYGPDLHSLSFCPSRHEKKNPSLLKQGPPATYSLSLWTQGPKNQDERTLAHNRPLQYTRILRYTAALYRHTYWQVSAGITYRQALSCSYNLYGTVYRSEGFTRAVINSAFLRHDVCTRMKENIVKFLIHLSFLGLPSSTYLFTAGVEGFWDFIRSHSSTQHSRYDSSGRGIGPSQRPLADNTKTVQDKHPCPRWDSNPRSQQAIGRRPMH
jgi:hypothetical protein